jgi:hypothetical protein
VIGSPHCPQVTLSDIELPLRSRDAKLIAWRKSALYELIEAANENENLIWWRHGGDLHYYALRPVLKRNLDKIL